MKSLSIALLAFLPLFVSGQNAWEMIYHNEFPLPSNGNICYVNPSEAWIVGEGFISKTSDGGTSWEMQYYKPDYYFVSVFFLDNQTGWVVGWSEVLKTTDGGVNWILQSLPNQLGLDVESVYFINQDTGWIAGSYKTIYHTTNGGQNWIVQHPYELLEHYFLYDIAFFDQYHGCAVGGKLMSPDQGFIMVTQDGGLNWTQLFPAGSNEFIKVHYASIDTIWACDHDEKIFISTDGGQSWGIYVDGLGFLTDMHFIDNNHALTISSGHYLNITYNGWQTHYLVDLGSFGMIRKFDFANDQLGLSIGNANIAKTIDGGESWVRLNDKFTDIDFFNDNVGIILPDLPNKIPLHTTDGGFSWQPMAINLNGYAYDLHFISGNTGFMIGSSTELLKTTDAGINWEIIDLPYDSTTYTDIQFIDGNKGFLTTYNSRFIKTTDGGNSWISYKFENVNHINGLYFADENNGWVVGGGGFCGITNDGGITWDEINIGSNNLTEVWFTDLNHGFAGSFSGRVFRSSDGGYEWQLIADTLYSLRKIEFADQNNGWIVTGHSILRTTDGGNTWTTDFELGVSTVTSITDFKCLDVDKAWICTTDGRVYYRDGTTGIYQINGDNAQVVFFPNPVKETLNMILNEPSSSVNDVEIFSMSGIRVMVKHFSLRENNTLSLQLPDLTSGIYIMKFKTETGVTSFKFVK